MAERAGVTAEAATSNRKSDGVLRQRGWPQLSSRYAEAPVYPTDVVAGVNRVGIILTIDWVIALQGLRQIIQQDLSFVVVDEGPELANLSATPWHTAGLVILGCWLEPFKRARYLRWLHKAAPAVRPIVLAHPDDNDAVIQLLASLGMAAYLPLAASVEETLLILRAVAKGYTILEPHHLAQSRRESGALGLLTQRETEVLQLVSEGCSNKEIASKLCVTPRTVGFHMTNMLAKAGATSRLQLVAFARKAGWCE